MTGAFYFGDAELFVVTAATLAGCLVSFIRTVVLVVRRRRSPE